MAKIEQVVTPFYELILSVEELKFLRVLVGESNGIKAKEILGAGGMAVQDELWEVLTSADRSYQEEG